MLPLLPKVVALAALAAAQHAPYPSETCQAALRDSPFTRDKPATRGQPIVAMTRARPAGGAGKRYYETARGE